MNLNKAGRASLGATPRLLIVEDEAVLRRVLGDYYARRGMQVSVAGSIAAARRLLAERVFDLFLIDVQLPDGDGLGLLGSVSRERALAMSSRPDPDRYERLGIRHLAKPFDLSALTQTFQEMLETAPP